MKKADTYCESCRYNYCNDEIGDYECTSSDISEELMEKHYTNGECNCPRWEVEGVEGEFDY
jgi:hypothetical protein